MPVVTISRQYGAGGSSIACSVAEELGVEVVDKNLIAEVARRLRMDQTDVEAEDERPRGLLDRLARSFTPLALGEGMAWSPPYPDSAYDPRRAIVQLTQEIIREVARTGNTVIVGRGAPHVLRDRPGMLHVFLVASEPVRIRAVMERETVSEAIARRRVHEMDANRAAYVHQVYGVDWQDPTLYSLVLNTGLIGHARAVRLILEAL